MDRLGNIAMYTKPNDKFPVTLLRAQCGEGELRMSRIGLRTLLDGVGQGARRQAVVLVLVVSGSLALQADGNLVRARRYWRARAASL